MEHLQDELYKQIKEEKGTVTVYLEPVKNLFSKI
ncbi:RNA-binding protein Hfq, partial [Bacillus toyonensis]